MTPAHSAAAPGPAADDLAPPAAAGGAAAGLSRGLPRKSRLGGGGLATIASVTDLAAAAEAAEQSQSEFSMTADDTEEAGVVMDDSSATAAESAVDVTVIRDSSSSGAGYVEIGRSWWPSMNLISTGWSPGAYDAPATPQTAAGAGTTPGGSTTAAATTSTPSAWWPGWLWMHNSTTYAQTGTGTEPASVSTAPAATGVTAETIDSYASTAATALEADAGSGLLDSGDSTVTRDARGQQRSGYMPHSLFQLLHMLFVTPVVWYVDAVSFVLRSGVDTAAWLVSLAVWWALLPGRLVWWAVTWPYTVMRMTLSRVVVW